MSHIFISYSHHDENYRDALITGLKKEGIEYWADTGLEVGEAWREQIDTNLEEAFALAVIVTNNSLQSPYVTYEWSWALGHEIPVLPLLFEEITYPVHDRLKAIQQQHKCYVEIPQAVFEAIKRYQKPSPLVSYIEDHISKMMLPFRFAVRILSWLNSYEDETFDVIFDYSPKFILLLVALEKLNTNKLPQLWMQNSHSFPREQKRKFQLLTEQFDDLSYELSLVSNTQVHRDVANWIINWYEKQTEPVLRQFVGYDNGYYNAFDEHLRHITESGLPLDDEKTRAEVFLAGLMIPNDLPDKFSQSIRHSFEQLTGQTYSINFHDD